MTGNSGETWKYGAFALRVPSALGRREWVALYAGREIRVVTRGLLRAELLLDDRPADRRHPWLSSGRLPFLSAQLQGDAGAVVVEVFALDLAASRIEVRAAGKRLAVTQIADPSGPTSS